LDESVFVGVDDGLDAVAEAEFGEDVGDVGFDGGVAEDELLGDFGVGVSSCEQEQHLGFSGREGFEFGRWESGGWMLCGRSFR
jgi:hypothetical protein